VFMLLSLEHFSFKLGCNFKITDRIFDLNYCG
jgi:hypothetical protein